MILRCFGLLLVCVVPTAGPAMADPAGPADGASVPPAATRPTKEETTEDIQLLDLEIPTVITASRREQSITTVPYAVSVITAEDIRRSGARTVPDALRQAAGVDVADLTYANSAASPRGFEGVLSRTVLVLVDGRQIYDSVFGGTAWGSWPFQLEDIERIEVIRGPGGVTWGSNAVNGVINIITRDPKDQAGLTFTGGGGSRGMNKEHLGYGFADRKLRLRVSGEYESSDGFPKGGSWLRTLEDDYKIGRMGVYAIYDAGPRDTLTLSGGSGLLDGGYPSPPTIGLGMSQNSGSQANYLLGKWEHRIADDNRLSVTGYVNDFWFRPLGKASEYRYEQLAFQVGHTFKPTEGHTLTWGIDSRTDIVDASSANPFLLSRDYASTAIIGAYVQDEWRFAPRWALNLGARLDYEFYGGFQPNARAALSREIADNHFVYGAVSRAFQMSPLGLRFLTFPLLNGLGYAVGREDIDAENLIAYEVGYRGTFFDRLNVNANVYWHDYDDLTTVSPQLGPPGLLHWKYGNRANAATYGVELEGRYAVTKQLMLLGNYTYQQLNWDGENPYTDKDLITPPRHKFMVGTRYDPLTDLHLSANLYFVDAVKSPDPDIPLLTRSVPSYFRLDLRAEYAFWKEQASVAVGVRNLLDPSHPEGTTIFLNRAEVPRMVYAEFRLTIR